MTTPTISETALTEISKLLDDVERVLHHQRKIAEGEGADGLFVPEDNNAVAEGAAYALDKVRRRLSDILLNAAACAPQAPTDVVRPRKLSVELSTISDLLDHQIQNAIQLSYLVRHIARILCVADLRCDQCQSVVEPPLEDGLPTDDGAVTTEYLEYLRTLTSDAPEDSARTQRIKNTLQVLLDHIDSQNNQLLAFRGGLEAMAETLEMLRDRAPLGSEARGAYGLGVTGACKILKKATEVADE